MKASEKIKGIVFAYNTEGEYSMVKDLGMEWMRLGISFPWADQMYGTLTERYQRDKEEIIKVHAAGFQIMPATFGVGAYRFDEEKGETVWMESIPAFVGEKGTEEFYENIRKTLAFIVEDLGDNAGMYWQTMNEIDNVVFAGPYSEQIVADVARAQAEGIVRANPNFKAGINLSAYNEHALEVADMVYAPGHSFGYLGDDQYFGSWQFGDVYSWTEVIDKLYERYGLPVLVNEWGYSSGGEYSPVHYVDPAEIPVGLPEECYTQKWYFEVPGGHTNEVQAAYIYEGLKLFAEHPHCLGSFLFCWRDAYKCYHCGGETCPSEDYWGIVTKDCKPKPAYYAVEKALKDFYAD